MKGIVDGDGDGIVESVENGPCVYRDGAQRTRSVLGSISLLFLHGTGTASRRPEGERARSTRDGRDDDGDGDARN